MDKALELVIEMHEWIWNRFQDDLKDAAPGEIDWRPLPQANSINAILRHLRIEARCHLVSLEHGEPMPVSVTDCMETDLESLDFERNLKELEESYTRFIAALRTTTLPALQQRTIMAYRNFPGDSLRPMHLLGFHQAIHLAMHWGQIRTIRNLYCKTRGEPARFFPENPTFPTEQG